MVALFRRKNSSSDAIDPAKTCRRCGRIIEVDPALSLSVFEGMHWLCFHLEYEHDGDPDLPCRDYSACPWWTIRYYEQKLHDLGLSPEVVRLEGIKRKSSAE